jgi:hypothetical protein
MKRAIILLIAGSLMSGVAAFSVSARPEAAPIQAR